MGMGVQELLIILAICILLFGGKRIASLGKDLGTGLKNFKGAIKELGPDEKDNE